MASNLIEREGMMMAPPSKNEVQDIAGLMSLAIQQGTSPEGLEKLFSLYERVEANKARMAFSGAMADLQADIPVIAKNRRVETGKYGYDYSELDFIANSLRPFMLKHGLSYRFDSAVDNDRVTVKCIVTHRAGHSEATKFAAPTSGMAGANAAQQTASALSYARRYALLMAFGLSTGEVDDDGQGGPVSPEQVGDLVTLLKETGVDRQRFLDWLGVDALEDLPAAKFGQAQKELKRRVKK